MRFRIISKSNFQHLRFFLVFNTLGLPGSLFVVTSTLLSDSASGKKMKVLVYQKNNVKIVQIQIGTIDRNFLNNLPDMLFEIIGAYSSCG